MFFKRKKFYTLLDIKNQIVYTPLIFAVLITLISIVAFYIFFMYQEKNRINLLIQSEKFYTNEVLKNYARDIKYNASANLDSVEVDLSNLVYEINGYISSFEDRYEKLTALKLKEFIKKIEINKDIRFVIFDSKNYKVLHGNDIIDYLRTLTSSKIKTDKFTVSMLKNIEYIGDDNLIYWIDNEKRDFRLSYFKNIDLVNMFIGAFSKIDDMKALTKKAILDSIVAKSRTIEHAHLAFYDEEEKRIYNYKGKGEYKDVSELKNLTLDDDFMFTFPKYHFKIYLISTYLEDEIEKIEAEFDYKFVMSVLIIIAISLLFMTSSAVFSKFINTIFNRYNKRLQQKSSLYKKWKDRYELAIIASNDGLWDLNLQTNEIFFSKKWLEIFKYDKDDILTLEDLKKLIHPEDKNQVLSKFDDLLKNKADDFLCEYRFKDKNGKYKWILSRGKAFETKNVKRVLMMSMDIDDRMKLTKELKNVEVLTEVGRIVIFKWKFNKELSVKFVSNSIESYGYSSDEFLNKNMKFLEFVHKDDRNSLIDIINTTINSNKNSFSHTYKVVNKDGNVRWVYNRTIIIRDENSEVVALFGYINDITNMKMNEEELKQRVEEEVEKNIQKDRLLNQQNKLASMGEMLGNIAHQWRQPLNNVNLLIHFIRDNHKNFTQDDLNEAIQSAKLQIDYMSKTIDDFKDFYQPSKEKKLFKLDEAIQKSYKIVQAGFERNNVSFEISSDDIEVDSYENEFEQVIVNIFNNAIDAAILRKKENEFDAKVNVDIRKEDKVIIEISNNCGNASKEVLDKMFEPYFTTKFENQGTGIGLYMAKIIVEKNMKGKIEASNINDGVKFTISI